MYNSGARASNITPGGFDVDSGGNLYIFDMYSSKLAKLDSSGSILWQKYVSSPAGVNSKGDGGLLSVHPNGASLILQLQESSTSISLCQFNISDGTLITKAVVSVAAGNSITVGNSYISGPDGSSNYWAFMTFKATVSGVTRACLRRYSLSATSPYTMTIASPSTQYHLITGASFSDVRYAYNSTTPSNHLVGYQNGMTFSSGHNTLASLTSTYTFTGGNFDSIALSGTSVVSNAIIMRDNVITKWTSSTNTKSWEKTHTISSVGGSHYYQQGMVIDTSTEQIYACYWNSTSGKIIIYSLNSSGVLQWTKSLYLNGATEVDAMMLKLRGTDLYLAFKYGTIDDGGMGILKISTDGTGTKTFTNNFVLATETGSVADTTNVTFTSSTPTTTSITLATTGSAFTITDNTGLPTYTRETT
jgi:hypothetical protein